MIISWGKPTIKVQRTDITGQNEITFPTPVDGSTQLSSEKGDKMEALIEGGEPEAVKYKRGKYSLELQIRIGQGRVDPSSGKITAETGKGLIDGVDGVVPGEYQVVVVPEDYGTTAGSGAPGFTMPKSVCSYVDTYSSADGIIRTYTFDSLKPDDDGAQIQWNA